MLFGGKVESVDEHIGLLVAHNVAADGLAEDSGIAIDVEIIVLQLEGQSNLFAKLIEIGGIFF